MPNRVIRDSIWSSPTLAKLPLDVQLHWPRWLLMADDWGCFNADSDVIRGLVYPKIPTMTAKKIQDLLGTYSHGGLLFLWSASDREWGYFTSWNGHQFCNVTHLDEDGKQLRHKRKTSEPPESELSAYLETHKLINQGVTEKLEQDRAGQNKYRNPNPNPNPNTPISPKGDDGFLQFWKSYPNKKEKGDAEKVWKILRPDKGLQQTILSALDAVKLSQAWTKDGGQFVPYPAKWLRRKCWEDELPSADDDFHPFPVDTEVSR